MKWTQDFPTVPGWYWYRDKRYLQRPDDYKAEPVHLVGDGFGSILFSGGGRNPRNIRYWPGLWAGPFDMPVQDVEYREHPAKDAE